MGRFSCFYGHFHVHHHKNKKSPSFETRVKMLQVGSQSRASTETAHKVSVVGNDVYYVNNELEYMPSVQRGFKSVEFNCAYDAESSEGFVNFEMGTLRRSLSEGCGLDKKVGMMGDNNTDDYIDQVFSYEESHNCTDRAESSIPYVAKSLGNTLPDYDQEAAPSLSHHCSSDQVNHDSNFSFCDPHGWEQEGEEDSHVPLCAECGDGSGGKKSANSRMSKSYSMPNFGSSLTSQGLCPHALDTCNRSVEDLIVHDINKEDISDDYADAVETTRLNTGDSFGRYEKLDVENAVLDHYGSFEYGCSSKDWIVPVPNEVAIMKAGRGNSSFTQWNSVPIQDFKIKRIDDWVFDLQHCCPVQETNDLDDWNNTVNRDSAPLKSVSKVDIKSNTGMEAAKKYLTSLNATATTAQLANHGLVAIPLLSAFVSLKILNMSGNSIVRITAGALPRGLHMLNLSKNMLPSIEGLRELTRLRVLDVSYNKISRIGHGLASCSSLKELYLAGNKISEAEGLHRLLKLAVLDLRFNKIATSKSLGQLAANYNSLQAISLEGNPAQKNVGDEQLKKYLQGLLPHLAYYNRQHIKSSTLKDSSERSVRLGISGHQFDRGARFDNKSSSRRGNQCNSVAKRSSHSSSHGQKGQLSDLVKHSRGRHGLGNKLESLRAGLSLHKSRSVNTLAAV